MSGVPQVRRGYWNWFESAPKTEPARTFYLATPPIKYPEEIEAEREAEARAPRKGWDGG